jgi:hypothetical protein
MVVGQLTDSNSISGNKSDKFAPHDQKSTQKEYSEVTIEKCYEGQNLFLSLRISNSFEILY